MLVYLTIILSIFGCASRAVWTSPVKANPPNQATTQPVGQKDNLGLSNKVRLNQYKSILLAVTDPKINF